MSSFCDLCEYEQSMWLHFVVDFCKIFKDFSDWTGNEYGMECDICVLVFAAGEEWRNMSAEQKAPYEKKSVEAGKKYEQQMAEYRKVILSDLPCSFMVA